MQNVIRIIILVTNLVFFIIFFRYTLEKVGNYYTLNFQPDKLDYLDSNIKVKQELLKKGKKYYKYSIVYNYKDKENTYSWESKNNYDENKLLKIAVMKAPPNSVVIPNDTNIEDGLIYIFFLLVSIFLEISIIIKLKNEYTNKRNSGFIT